MFVIVPVEVPFTNTDAPIKGFPSLSDIVPEIIFDGNKVKAYKMKIKSVTMEMVIMFFFVITRFLKVKKIIFCIYSIDIEILDGD